MKVLMIFCPMVDRSALKTVPWILGSINCHSCVFVRQVSRVDEIAAKWTKPTPEPALFESSITNSACVLTAAEQWATIGRLGAEFFFDAEQLVVLGHAITAAGGTSFDLASR